MSGPDGDLAQNWHPVGSEHSFELSHQLKPLEAFQVDARSPVESFKDDCVFLQGLTLNLPDGGSHPEGAKKLLTGVTDGYGQSLDQRLAQSPVGSAPHGLLYMGAMSSDGPDKGISYPTKSGTPGIPQDNPFAIFQNLFNMAPGGGGGGGAPGGAKDPRKASIIDSALDDMKRLRAKLGGVEADKLDLHLESLREVEKLVKGTGGPVVSTASCKEPFVDMSKFAAEDCAPGFSDAKYAKFPDIFRADIDLMVLAMACGLTKVGVLQTSHHTSDLNLARFPGTEMNALNPNGMRSHEASHNNITAYIAQRRWFTQQFAYLLHKLKSTPEADSSGTMLDNSLIVLCSEVANGVNHSKANMPFVLAGRAGGALKTDRLLQYNNAPHTNLLVSIANAMGDSIGSFGENCTGPLSGLLG